MSRRASPQAHTRPTLLSDACTAALQLGDNGMWGIGQEHHTTPVLDRVAFIDLYDLVGIVASAHWDGVVLCEHATMTTDAGPAEVLIAHAVDRCGASLTLARHDCITMVLRDAVGTPDDICRRSLGLPTLPEPRSVATPLVAAWLEELIELSFDEEMAQWTSSWEGCADLHPSASTAISRNPLDLAQETISDAATTSWDRLLDIARSVGRAPGGLGAATLAWLDGPSFARILLATYPPVSAMLATLDSIVDQPTAQGIRQCIEASMLGDRRVVDSTLDDQGMPFP